MKATRLSFHPAICLERPVMEYGTMGHHVGGSTWWGASALHNRVLVSKGRRFRLRLWIMLANYALRRPLMAQPWSCRRQLSRLLQMHLLIQSISNFNSKFSFLTFSALIANTLESFFIYLFKCLLFFSDTPIPSHHVIPKVKFMEESTFNCSKSNELWFSPKPSAADLHGQQLLVPDSPSLLFFLLFQLSHWLSLLWVLSIFEWKAFLFCLFLEWFLKDTVYSVCRVWNGKQPGFNTCASTLSRYEDKIIRSMWLKLFFISSCLEPLGCSIDWFYRILCFQQFVNNFVFEVSINVRHFIQIKGEPSVMDEFSCLLLGL